MEGVRWDRDRSNNNFTCEMMLFSQLWLNQEQRSPWKAWTPQHKNSNVSRPVYRSAVKMKKYASKEYQYTSMMHHTMFSHRFHIKQVIPLTCAIWAFIRLYFFRLWYDWFFRLLAATDSFGITKVYEWLCVLIYWWVPGVCSWVTESTFSFSILSLNSFSSL